MLKSAGLIALLLFLPLQVLMRGDFPALPPLLVGGIQALGSRSISEPTALLIIGAALIGAAYAARR
jgi:hypothetical protein